VETEQFVSCDLCMQYTCWW